MNMELKTKTGIVIPEPEKRRKKDMRGTNNRHLKAEWQDIVSLERGWAQEIRYDDGETAAKKARAIKNKFRGTDYSIAVSVEESTVVVVRV